MCNKCMIEQRPDRGNTCLEGGSYLMNWNGCSNCDSRDIPGERDRKIESDIAEHGDINSDDENEEISFVHECKACKHEICTHYYTFTVTENTQEYMMDCFLCGKGSQTIEHFVNEDNDTTAVHETLSESIKTPTPVNALDSLMANITIVDNPVEESGSDEDEWED